MSRLSYVTRTLPPRAPEPVQATRGAGLLLVGVALVVANLFLLQGWSVLRSSPEAWQWLLLVRAQPLSLAAQGVLAVLTCVGAWAGIRRLARLRRALGRGRRRSPLALRPAAADGIRRS